MRSIYLLSPLLCLSMVAYATTSPDQYRQQVVEYSWDIKSAEQGIISADQSLAIKRVALLPNLSSSGRFYYNMRHVVGARDWHFNFEPQIIETLYGGGVLRADVEGAKLTTAKARYEAEYTRLEVEYAADYAYWNLWAMSRYREVMGEYVEIIRSEEEVTQRRYTEGYISKGNLLMISSRLSEAEYEYISSEQSRLTALNNFNTLRGRGADDSVRLIGVDMSLLAPLPRRIPLGEVVANRPDYSSQLLSEQVASATTRSARGAYNPQLRGGLSGSWHTNTPNVSGSTHLDGTLFVELSMPIFHFGERRKTTALYRTAERVAHINSEILYDKISQDEGDAWVMLVESRAQASAATRSLQIASENLDLSTYSYNEGEVSVVELIQSQISWIDIYTNVINSHYNYMVALSYYRFITCQ